jgi:protein involved in polysaccharide export with SLBB domain
MQAKSLIQKAQQLLTALALIATVAISAQDLSQFDKLSDEQLKGYLKQYEQQGLSESELIMMAKARGASEADIAKFRQRIEGLKGAKSPKGQGVGVAAQTSFFGIVPDSTGVNQNPKELQPKKDPSYIFGAAFFDQAQSNLAPNLQLATPERYQLGPGDQISIALWGAAANVYQETISSSGNIVIDGVGPIGLSGKTVAQARTTLKAQLSAIYEGLGDQFKNSAQEVNLDLSLTKARSIVINIVGQVEKPGTYTLSGYTTPLNALYAAGGISEVGSYRNIQVLRANKVVGTIDLYQYFVKGLETNITLRDQDILLIPYVGAQVTAVGGLKQPGIFELKSGETLADLLQYTGGFTPDAYAGSVSVARYDGTQVATERVTAHNYKKTALSTGALITASLVSDQQKNRVSIEGAVPVAGSFGLEQAGTVSALIALAQGLKEEALGSFALLYRTSGGTKETSLVSVDLKKALSGAQDPTLQSGDRLVILSEEALAPEQKINISGLVKKPGTFDYFTGMTPSDLIAMAEGIQAGADLSKVSIYRSTLDERGALTITSFEVALDDTYAPQNPESQKPLQANDLVVLRSKEDFRPIKFVSIEGAVRYPGTYALKEGYSFQDLLQDAGGLTPQASQDGMYIKRLVDQKTAEKIKEQAQRDSIAIDPLATLPTLNIPVSSDPTRMVPLLKANDRVLVLESDNSITVQGSVQEPTAMSFVSGRSAYSYIQDAGGFNSNAKKSKVYVVYQNQRVRGTSSFLFFKKYPKLLAGATVVVPAKPENTNRLSAQEIIGITTSIATLGILINTLIVK